MLPMCWLLKSRRSIFEKTYLILEACKTLADAVKRMQTQHKHFQLICFLTEAKTFIEAALCCNKHALSTRISFQSLEKTDFTLFFFFPKQSNLRFSSSTAYQTFKETSRPRDYDENLPHQLGDDSYLLAFRAFICLENSEGAEAEGRVQNLFIMPQIRSPCFFQIF